MFSVILKSFLFNYVGRESRRNNVEQGTLELDGRIAKAINIIEKAFLTESALEERLERILRNEFRAIVQVDMSAVYNMEWKH
ncbi:hypothetical protein QBC38DRAFT_462312, partial [Podospora fimiseda]